MRELIEAALEVYNNPINLTFIKFGKVIKEFIDDNTMQKAMKAIGNTHMETAYRIASRMDEYKDKRRALGDVALCLENAYTAYLDSYKKLPKRWDAHIPYLWIANEINVAVNGTDKIEIALYQICSSIAACYKALGESPELIKEWICNKERPFCYSGYETIKDLLGEKEAYECLAEDVDLGERGAYGYLLRHGVCLDDYRREEVGSTNDSDGISFGEEDPIIYLD